MVKGKALTYGDTIGIIAPASPLAEPEMVSKAKAALEMLGFRVKLGQTCFERCGGYLAGTAKRRAEDVHHMFKDPEVDAVMCLRGGYGSMHVLPLLDYELIAEHPKLFIGYSDITALHTAFWQKAGLVTLHGPMASPEIVGDLDDYSKESLLRALTQNGRLGKVANPPGTRIECLVPGRATGRLVGGNLSLLAATIGTPYEIETKDRILFLEDVGEEPYKIDRMLTQLDMANKLAEAAGFVIGDWTGCEAKSLPDSFTVKDLLERIVAPYGKPTIYNVMAGHTKPLMTLPLGVTVSLHATERVLIIEESITR